ncbi:uncharacterized protein Triagg1_5640 [Trichoderma aggressivum f. europaeum]|uniref:Uncharacterized protein n=1 Tax=Trichoderma aggressivum f. europaeum TaxID=173218 RepID=A0AAE1IEB2_9HYPO|nr:hypothetical protein Triagg1_5640 [Trichoderma aggressivum f. europaeum]
MCFWDTYLYMCGCYDVKLKSQCHEAPQEGRQVCTVGPQVVKGSWCYAQPFLCDRCRRIEYQSGRPARRYVPSWSEIAPGAKARAEAKARYWH